VVLEQLHDALGRVLHAQPEWLGDLLGDRRASGVDVERDLAAEEVVRVDVAQDHIAVGDRRGLHAIRRAAADPRAGGVRPDLDPARGGVDPDVAPRSGPDRVDLHQRDVEQEAPDVGEVLDVVIAVGDQRQVEAGAADVVQTTFSVPSWPAR
jgi:hypothetical protein